MRRSGHTFHSGMGGRFLRALSAVVLKNELHALDVHGVVVIWVAMAASPNGTDPEARSFEPVARETRQWKY